VDGRHCLLPFPSSFFLEEEGSPTGYRVAFGPTSLPASNDGTRMDPTRWNRKDGFPILGSLYPLFPGVSLEGVVGHRRLEAYDEIDVRTVILHAATGARVPHFVELEADAAGSDRQLLLLRPVVPLDNATRYVVGIRGLTDTFGTLLEPPAGFAALRDGAPTDDPDLERQRAHYETEVWPVLEADGLPRAELQLAWDLVTVSEEATTRRALWLREDALARVPAGGPPYELDPWEDADCGAGGAPDIGRSLSGTMTVPLYLTDWAPGSVLTEGEEGLPVYNGDAKVPFRVLVPCTLLADPRPGMLLQYGHGLLGTFGELDSGHLRGLANRHGWILFAVEWTGMKQADVWKITEMIGNDRSGFGIIPDRLLQGFVEQLLAARMLLGDLAQDPALGQGGVSLVDTSVLHFYGNSQGAVLGGAYVALSKDIRRAVLGVGGMPFTLLLTRAQGFVPYFQILQSIHSDWADTTLSIPLMQMLWDEAEAGGWAHLLTERGVDEQTPTKQVLLQTAIGDASVTTLGAHVMARAYGASLVEPATRPVFGLTERTPPFEGSALVEYDYGVEEPVESVVGDRVAGVHDVMRNERAAQDQIGAFLGEGVVRHFCDGPCVRTLD